MYIKLLWYVQNNETVAYNMRKGIKAAITHTCKNIKHYYVYRKKKIKMKNCVKFEL